MGSLSAYNDKYKSVETGNSPIIYGYITSGSYVVTHLLEGKNELVLAFADWAVIKLMAYYTSEGDLAYKMAYKLYFKFNNNKLEAIKLLNDYCKGNGIVIINIDELLKSFGYDNRENRDSFLGLRDKPNIVYKLPYVEKIHYTKDSTPLFEDYTPLFEGYRHRSCSVVRMVSMMNEDVYYMDGECNDEGTEKFQRVVTKCELAGIEPPNSMVDGLCILDSKQFKLYKQLLLPIAHVFKDISILKIEEKNLPRLQYAINLTVIGGNKGALHFGDIKTMVGCRFMGVDVSIDSVEHVENCTFMGCSISINKACELSGVTIEYCAVRIRGSLYSLDAWICGKSVIKIDSLPEYLNIEAMRAQVFDTNKNDATTKCKNVLRGHNKSALIINEKTDMSGINTNLVGVDDGLLDIIN